MTDTESPGVLPTFTEELRQAQRRMLRIGANLGAVLLVAFSATDALVAPEAWGRLLAVRAAAAVALLGLGVAVARSWIPELLAGVLILAAVCAPVEVAVFATGGLSSPYLLAMLIPLGAVSILVPLQLGEAAVLHGTVVGIALLPLANRASAEPRAFILAVAYFATLSLIGLVGAGLQEALRQREHRARGEAARQVGLANLGMLAGGLAHELSNPLAAVSLELELLERELGRPARLENVHLGVARMRDILNAMRQGARVADGKLSQTDLSHQVELALALLAPKLRQVRIERELAALPPVLAQPTLVGQVLSNLLINAGDALHQQANPRIWVRLRQEGELAVVEVEDNGPGVPEPLRARIFEPFISTKGEDGNGLGLWICSEIARFHGGALSVDAGASGGARFRFSLPVAGRTQAGPTARPRG